MDNLHRAWWKEAVVYQVYPRSFLDTNGDGIGDLPGVTRKLDYIQLLGANVIWLNPIYQSPNDDNGYDISDYRTIMREFGTMEDFDTLLNAAHTRGIRVILDLVVNHTSDEHPWFIESRKGPDSPYRDYYIWREGQNGNAPNNWGSAFSGSAWQQDGQDGMYYLHIFSKHQPDLNWENARMRRDVYDIMRFWLDKGVDGFRMDVINYISKLEGLPDTPCNGLYGSYQAGCANGPHIHEYLKEMNRSVLAGQDVMTVGEMPAITVEQAQHYTSETENELNMVFQFEHMSLDDGPLGKWSDRRATLDQLRDSFRHWQEGLSVVGWNSLYWNNHDQPRVVSRFGNDQTESERVLSAKMLATLLYMMRGTPYVYQGEELGMTNARFPSIDDYPDIQSRNAYRELTAKGVATPEQMLRYIQARGRDNARTPMQWTADANAGFTDGTPWIKLNPNYPTLNAASELSDLNSVFHYYRKLIALRKQYDVIVYGRYDQLLDRDKRIFAYERTLERQRLLVLCNFSGERTQVLRLDDYGMTGGRWLIGNLNDDRRVAFQLQPYEARVYLLEDGGNGGRML